MLRLATRTDDRWLPLALEHLDAVLVDHVHCEHKAAATALALVSRYPDDPALVLQLSALASEEAEHLRRIASVCVSRGLAIGHPQRDAYAKALLARVRTSPLDGRVDRLLSCAIIEARSCERLQLLAGGLADPVRGDPTLAPIYRELWVDEARHHALFVDLAARSLARVGVDEGAARAQIDARLAQLCAAEAEIVVGLPLRPAIH